MSIDAMRWAKKVKTGKSSSKAILTGWLICAVLTCALIHLSLRLQRLLRWTERRCLQACSICRKSARLSIQVNGAAGQSKFLCTSCSVLRKASPMPNRPKTELFKGSQNGTVNLNRTENGTVNTNSAINGTISGDKGTKTGLLTVRNLTKEYRFSFKQSQNGTRNLPRNHKDLNPTHRELVEPVIPDYPDQPYRNWATAAIRQIPDV